MYSITDTDSMLSNRSVDWVRAIEGICCCPMLIRCARDSYDEEDKNFELIFLTEHGAFIWPIARFGSFQDTDRIACAIASAVHWWRTHNI